MGIRKRRVRLLTPALASFGEERENYFVGRFPRVVAAFQPWANFLYAFSVFEFAFTSWHGQFIKDFLDVRFAGFFPVPAS